MKNDKVNKILEYLKNELKYNNCNINTKEKGWEQYNGLDDDLLHYIRKIEKENKRLNNIIKDIKSQLDYLETYSSKEDVFEDMKRRLDRIESIVNRK